MGGLVDIAAVQQGDALGCTCGGQSNGAFKRSIVAADNQHLLAGHAQPWLCVVEKLQVCKLGQTIYLEQLGLKRTHAGRNDDDLGVELLAL